MKVFEQKRTNKNREPGDFVREQKSRKSLFSSLSNFENNGQPDADIVLPDSLNKQIRVLQTIQSNNQKTAVIIQLQKSYGNAYIQRLLDCMFPQKQKEKLPATEIEKDSSSQTSIGNPATLKNDIETNRELKGQSNPEEESTKALRIRRGWFLFNIGQVVDDPIMIKPRGGRAGSTGFIIEEDKTVSSEPIPALRVGEEVLTESEFFKVQLTELKIHIRIAIWPPENETFMALEEFGYYYGGPFDYRFRTYEGVVVHENEHRNQIIRIWENHFPDLVNKVGQISTSTETEAEDQYRKLNGEFRENMEADWLEQGTEEEPERVEWEYYHRQYDELTNRPSGSGTV